MNNVAAEIRYLIWEPINPKRQVLPVILEKTDQAAVRALSKRAITKF